MPTKADLEIKNRELQRQINALKTQQRTWGNEALALAKEKGYCNDIQTFLDDQGIPYDVPNVTMTVNVSFRIEAEMTDVMDEYTLGFLQSCLNQDVFEQFGWRDAHDEDIKEILEVSVDHFEVVGVERNKSDG